MDTMRFSLTAPPLEPWAGCLPKPSWIVNNRDVFDELYDPYRTLRFPFFFLQFDLVCERGSLGFVSTSVIFAGFVVGSVSVSTISDKFGRKLPLFVCGFFCCLFNFVSAFAPAFWVFALFRAIVGFMIGKMPVLAVSFNYEMFVYLFL